jgi:hypothetical protein
MANPNPNPNPNPDPNPHPNPNPNPNRRTIGGPQCQTCCCIGGQRTQRAGYTQQV